MKRGKDEVTDEEKVDATGKAIEVDHDVFRFILFPLKTLLTWNCVNTQVTLNENPAPRRRSTRRK